MAIGDQLSVSHGLYTHHGIDMGDGTVIHYGQGLADLENATVEVVTFEEFSIGKSVTVIQSESCFEGTIIAERAISRLGENCYDVFDNNCEHFANWCRSGKATSTQAAATKTILRQSAAVASRPMLRNAVRNAAMRRSIAAPLIVADLIQAGVELAAVRKGKSEQESNRLGARAGGGNFIGHWSHGRWTNRSGIRLWLMVCRSNCCPSNHTVGPTSDAQG